MQNPELTQDNNIALKKQKPSLIEKIITPKEIRLIKDRNEQLNGLLGSDSAEYENQLNQWIREISTRLNRLKGKSVRTSVVVPAYNEQQEILQPLEALSKQDYKDGLEVIVVVNNSTDRTAEIARACSAKVIEYDLSDEERKNLAPIAVARQRGLDASLGTYVVSTDADTIFKSSWIRSLVKLLTDPKISLATGRLYSLDTTLELELAARAFALSRRYKMLSIGHSHPGGIALGANSAFRKADAIKIGGYDLTVYPGEDTYMFEQLSKLGKPTMPFSNDAAVWTSHRRLGNTPLKKLAAEHLKATLTGSREDTLKSRYGLRENPINIRRK